MIFKFINLKYSNFLIFLPSFRCIILLYVWLSIMNITCTIRNSMFVSRGCWQHVSFRLTYIRFIMLTYYLTVLLLLSPAAPLIRILTFFTHYHRIVIYIIILSKMNPLYYWAIHMIFTSKEICNYYNNTVSIVIKKIEKILWWW